MKISWIFFAVVAAVVLAGLGVAILQRDGDPALEGAVEPTAPSPAATASTATGTAPAAVDEPTHQGLLHGRITTVGGATYEGRLRFGGDEEALWGQYFNGTKRDNPWAAHVPAERLPRKRLSFELFVIEITFGSRPIDLTRPFMVRFGNLARIDARGRDLRVTLESGTVFHLDRFGADDLADGLRVWDAGHGVVDLHEVRIRSIELFPAEKPLTGPDAGSAGASIPLHGTVHTRQGVFTGFIRWNRGQCLGSDELDGRTADGELRLRFDSIRSIARRSGDSSLVTLRDGREIAFFDTSEAGQGVPGIHVHDPRSGRVSISREVFERVDFSAGGHGPVYGDFPPGGPLTGGVTTRGGRRLTGRLVYDLDESERAETLDAPSRGVHYTIPFGRIASIALPGRDEMGTRPATVTLHHGEELRLEPSGDLGQGNAGMLVFADGRERPEYVPWADVERIDLDRPPTVERQPGVQSRPGPGRR